MKHLEKTITDPDTGEVVCLCCARVVEIQNVVVQEDVNLEEANDKRQHGSSQITLHDKGLHTKLEYNTDHAGKRITDENKIKQLRKWQQRIVTSSPMDRRLYNALRHHQRILDYLQIPRPIAITSTEILRSAIKQGNTKGFAYDYLCAAAIYWAYKQRSVSANIPLIMGKLKLRRSTFMKYCGKLNERLDLKATDQTKDRIFVIITRFANELKLSLKITKTAGILLDLTRKMEPLIVGGRDPKGIAAALLYLSIKYHAKNRNYFDAYQEEIAEASKVTAVTIRNRVKDLQLVYEKFIMLQQAKVQIAAYRKEAER